MLYMFVYSYMHSHRGEGTPCRSQFSSSIMWNEEPNSEAGQQIPLLAQPSPGPSMAFYMGIVMRKHVNTFVCF